MLSFCLAFEKKAQSLIRIGLVPFTEPVQLWGILVLQRCSLDFAWVQEAASIPARVLVCQQGAGAGWKPCRAAQGCMGDPFPPHCPTCQPEALGACRDCCWVLHSWGAHSSHLAEETPAVARERRSGALAHVLAPRWRARVRSYGSQQTHPRRGHEPRCHRCRRAGHRSPRTGSSGQSGPISSVVAWSRSQGLQWCF